MKCLDAAKKSWNKAAEGEASGRIGNLFLLQGNPQKSIAYLKQQSQIAADLSDAESRCAACSRLALALDQLGQADKALNELTLVHTISEQAGDLHLQSQACRALGTLYSKLDRLSDAVEMLQKHFTLLKAILNETSRNQNPHGHSSSGSSSGHKKMPMITLLDLDLARTYIGISKGNQLLGSYVVNLKIDLTTMLDWKLNRTELREPSNVMCEPLPYCEPVFESAPPADTEESGVAGDA